LSASKASGLLFYCFGDYSAFCVFPDCDNDKNGIMGLRGMMCPNLFPTTAFRVWYGEGLLHCGLWGFFFMDWQLFLGVEF
jgi:hypothetical protein